MTAALTLSVSPALSQTAVTPAPTTPMQEQGAQPSPEMSGQNSDGMRNMMREMMQEMLQDTPRTHGRRDNRAERRGGDRWRDGPRMGRHQRADRQEMMRGHGGRGSGMMHGARMKMMFAIVDGDGDGAISLAEVQDFHGRIFNAVDENGDGSVELTEIESFFHGSSEEARD